MEDVGIYYVHLVYLPVIWDFCGYLVYFMAIWFIFSCFGMLDREKSGNPG
jgi:hypothetical protein